LLAYGKGLTEKDRIDGDFNVYGSNGIVGTHNEYFVEGPFIIVGRKGSVGELHFSKNNGNPIDTTFYISKKQLKKDIELELLFYLLKLIDLKSLDNQSAIPGINRNDVYKLKINLPPKESQNKILKIIKDEVEIIDKNKNLILNFQGKIKNKINNIWSD
jgi:type I restriction enzyme S subunit